MNIAVVERSATERELSLEIPGDKLSTLVEAKIDSIRKRIALPGFRAGKVPKDVVRKRFGESIRGEAIVGYVTRGTGVAVHSKMCPNVQSLMYDVERKIEVEWARSTADAWVKWAT